MQGSAARRSGRHGRPQSLHRAGSRHHRLICRTPSRGASRSTSKAARRSTARAARHFDPALRSGPYARRRRSDQCLAQPEHHAEASRRSGSNRPRSARRFGVAPVQRNRACESGPRATGRWSTPKSARRARSRARSPDDERYVAAAATWPRRRPTSSAADPPAPGHSRSPTTLARPTACRPKAGSPVADAPCAPFQPASAEKVAVSPPPARLLLHQRRLLHGSCTGSCTRSRRTPTPASCVAPTIKPMAPERESRALRLLEGFGFSGWRVGTAPIRTSDHHEIHYRKGFERRVPALGSTLPVC